MKTIALQQFCAFFDKGSSERLDGMSASVVDALAPAEREEAFQFTLEQIENSGGTDELVHILFMIDADKARVAVDSLLATGRLTGEAETTAAFHLYRMKPDDGMLLVFPKYYQSENKWVKQLAITQTPTDRPTHALISALETVVVCDSDSHTRYKALDKLLKVRGIFPSADLDSAHSVFVRRNASGVEPGDRRAMLVDLDREYPVRYVD